MFDSTDKNTLTIDIEQDAIIAHSETISDFMLLKMLDIALQSKLQPRNLFDYLRCVLNRKLIQVLSGRFVVSNCEARHDSHASAKFSTLAGQFKQVLRE